MTSMQAIKKAINVFEKKDLGEIRAVKIIEVQGTCKDIASVLITIEYISNTIGSEIYDTVYLLQITEGQEKNIEIQPIFG